MKKLFKTFTNLLDKHNKAVEFGLMIEMQSDSGKYFKADVADSDAGKIIDALKELKYSEINRSTNTKKMTAEIEAKVSKMQDVFVSKLMEIEGISETKAVQLYHGLAYQVLDELGYRYSVEVVIEDKKQVIKEVHKQLEKIVYCKKFYPMCGSNKTFIKNTEYRSIKVAEVKKEIKKLLQSN